MSSVSDSSACDAFVRELVAGEYDWAIAEAGSASAVVRARLGPSPALRDAAALFHDAFERFLQRWDPGDPLPPSAACRLVDLATSFSPRRWFIIMLARLRRGRAFLLTPEELSPVLRSPVDFDLAVLRSLATYYPAPPPTRDLSEDLGFRSYCDLLVAWLDSSRNPGYCSSRLLELGNLDTTSMGFQDYVLSSESELAICLDELLFQSEAVVLAQLLQTLYRASLRAGFPALANFRHALSSLGATWENLEFQPALVLPSGDRVLFPKVSVRTLEDENYLRARAEDGLAAPLPPWLAAAGPAPKPEFLDN